MKINQFTVNPFGENVYIVWSEITHNAVVIDPGMMTEDERNTIMSFLNQNNLNVQMILLTHAHVDHAASANWLSCATGAAIHMSAKDDMLASHLQEQVHMFGLGITVLPLANYTAVDERAALSLDGNEIRVIKTPGHTPGSVAFYLPALGVLFAGDTIFQGSVGRTDLPGGDFNALTSSIKNKILKLPTQTKILPGHGSHTTIATEIATNPYC
jgi:glyoxylase-like metal-dependent hydrolase (beta-lactamase superfamily II)